MSDPKSTAGVRGVYDGGGAEAVPQGLEVDGDDHGGGVATVLGELGGVEVLEQGAEGLPEPLVVAELRIELALAG